MNTSLSLAAMEQDGIGVNRTAFQLSLCCSSSCLSAEVTAES